MAEMSGAMLWLFASGATVAGNTCVLERLQNEPFWDETVVGSTSEEQGHRHAFGDCACQSGFTGAHDAPPWAAFKDWQTVRQYLTPLAFVPYARLAHEQNVTTLVVDWRFPSWQAPEGPSHETMTLSDGLSSMAHAMQHWLHKPGGRSTCFENIECTVAVFLVEIWRTVRASLAIDRALDESSFAEHWPEKAWPWEELFERGWGPVVIGSLIIFARLFHKEPMTHWNHIGVRLDASRADDVLPCCSGDAALGALLKANSASRDSVLQALSSMPEFMCCGSLQRWLHTTLPVLQLAGSALSPREAWHESRSTSIEDLTHTLCSSVERITLAGGSAVLHVHGATVFTKPDGEGRLWHHIEVLHFVSSGDECVRVTTFGKTAAERHYYAHALTLPSLSHLARWRCSTAGGDPNEAVRARTASFFGYDAVLYCKLPAIERDHPEGVLNVKLDAPNVAGWTVPTLSLCPLAGTSMGTASRGNLEPAARLPHPLRSSGSLPRFRLAACTEPLHNYEFFRATAPNLLDEFIEYHLMLGIEHFTIFDTEGSFEEPLLKYVQSGVVEYVSRWPALFGGDKYSDVAIQRSIVVEVEAENYCLWRYRGRADWAAVLHSPDEFLYMPQDMAPTGNDGNVEGSLLRFLDRLEPRRSAISHIEVRQVPYGGPPEAAQTVMGRYVHRTPTAFDAPHTLIANVLNVAQLGVHPARPRPSADGEDPLLVVHADPLADLRVNHYINSIGGRERCPLKLCSTRDDGAVWVSQAVEARLQHRK